MFAEIIFALDPIFHKPLLMYGGIFTGLLFITTASVGYAVSKGKLDFKWHQRLVISLILVVLFHAALGIIYFL
jgi:hypothetical protein